MPNRLADSNSTYLRQHANQPVEWQPWGDDAFADARERGVPTFISIGYASCHWCHVMARESFDDPAVASFINEHFVAIKVDREEHPAVDSVYLDAAQGISGVAGWPLTIFATPDGEPFAAGTYFPAEIEDGTPTFIDFAGTIADEWATSAEELTTAAKHITASLVYSRDHYAGAITFTDPKDRIPPVDGVLPAPPKRSDFSIASTIAKLRAEFDDTFGGFGTEPKFLNAPLLMGLIHHDFEGWAMTSASLHAMMRGAVHDVVAGGFMRYSTTRSWGLPHFEKMLPDNAQLLTLYSVATTKARVLGQDARGFERAARGIVAWLEREMLTESGTFATSLDAEATDAEGNRYEGVHVAWSRAQLLALLGEDVGWASEVFGMTTKGTDEHTLFVPSYRVDPEDVDQRRLDSVLARMRAGRDARPHASRDDLVVAEWNGLAIDALIVAALHLDEPRWVDVAERAATCIWNTHRVSGRMRRGSRDGETGRALGSAGDLGAMAIGMLRLAAVRGDSVWLDRAISLLDEADAHFAARGGGWYDSAVDADSLIYRPRDGSDDPSPSPVSLLIAANHLAARLGHRERRRTAHLAERSRIQRLVDAPRFAGWALHDALLRASPRPPAETVVTAPTKAEAWPLAVVAAAQDEPGELILIGDASVGPTAFGGMFEARTAVSEPTAYVCRAGICELPRTSFA